MRWYCLHRMCGGLFLSGTVDGMRVIPVGVEEMVFLTGLGWGWMTVITFLARGFLAAMESYRCRKWLNFRLPASKRDARACTSGFSEKIQVSLQPVGARGVRRSRRRRSECFCGAEVGQGP